MIKKAINIIDDKFYVSCVIICAGIMWLNNFEIIKLDLYYHLLLWLAIPIFIILWKIDRSEKNTEKMIGMLIDAIREKVENGR